MMDFVDNDKKNLKNNGDKKSKKLFLRHADINNRKRVVEIKQGKAVQNSFTLSSVESKTLTPQSTQLEDQLHILRKANVVVETGVKFIKVREGLANLDNDPNEEKGAKLKEHQDNQPKDAHKDRPLAPNSNVEDVPKVETPAHKTLIEQKKKSSKITHSDEETKSKNISKKEKVKDSSCWNRSNLIAVLDEEFGNIEKRRSVASFKRAQEKVKRRKRQDSGDSKPAKIYREIILDEDITISDLANKLSELSTNLFVELKKLGISTKNKEYVLSKDIAELVALSLGHKVKISAQSKLETMLSLNNDDPALLAKRPPIVAFMGHVDHGKTSLLDAFSSSNKVLEESGGITQHLGSYNVKFDDGESITFLDTPGHEAFLKIRSRSSAITDIIVLVISAEEGIKAQTIEAIKHAQQFKVPIIVALNKVDKDDTKLDKIKNDLLSYDIVSEELGGEAMVVNVSAKNNINLDKLKESIILLSELLDLKANSQANASGVILESRVDPKIGHCSNILVEQGVLKVGNIVISGINIGKIRSIFDHNGANISDIPPGFVGNILGFSTSPDAGEKFYVLDSEQQALDIINYRKKLQKRNESTKISSNFDQLFNKPKTQDLFFIIKADVFSSMDAIHNSIYKIEHPDVTVKIVHTGLGNINLSDINLAITANASIVGFNVKTDPNAANYADKYSVIIKLFSNIYQIIDYIKLRVSKILSPIVKEIYLGTAKVRKIFNLSKAGYIIGCYISDGIIKQDAKLKIFRNDQIIHEGFIKTIRQQKNQVKEARVGIECGISLKDDFTNVAEEDIIKIYEIVEEENSI